MAGIQRLREPSSLSRTAATGSVAVLGAGIQGVCCALELAHRGWQVDLFDRSAQPMMGASGFNEGKIHLGFVYSNDPSRQTAQMMIEAAFNFLPYLRRWLGSSWQLPDLSTPFVYSLHRESLLNALDIEEQFAFIARRITELYARGEAYLGLPRGASPVLSRIDPPSAKLDAEQIPAAWQTLERAVDAEALARDLRAAVSRCRSIRFIAGTEVLAADPSQHAVRIDVSQGGQAIEASYEHAVNTLWDGRLAIDATAGITPHRRWLHRFKYGIMIHGARWEHAFSTTVVLGPFGDIVTYPSGKIYLSWYPACLAAVSEDLVPQSPPQEPIEPARSELIHKSLSALGAIYPPLEALDLGDGASIQVEGRQIFAWANHLDIDRHESELHARADVGITSKGRFHSINTGKYTLGPTFAVELGERLGAAARSPALVTASL
ncbi:MAG: FAD-dependent oxidoreductase [Acidobacteriota bacterium]